MYHAETSATHHGAHSDRTATLANLLDPLSDGDRKRAHTRSVAAVADTITDRMPTAGRWWWNCATTITWPNGRTVGFNYDANGNVISVTPPGHPVHVHGFGYTAIGVTSSYAPPDVGPGNETTTYTYNVDRQLERVDRPDGQAVSLGYDSGGRVSVSGNAILPRYGKRIFPTLLTEEGLG